MVMLVLVMPLLKMIQLKEIVKIKMQVVLIGVSIAHQEIMLSGWLKIVQKPVENVVVGITMDMFALKLTTMQIALPMHNKDIVINIKIGWLLIVQNLALAEKRAKLIEIHFWLALIFLLFVKFYVEFFWIQDFCMYIFGFFKIEIKMFC